MEQELDVNVKQRSAKTLLPFFSVEGEEQGDIILKYVRESDGELVSEVDGDTTRVFVWYDFGESIPESVWNMFEVVGVIDKQAEEDMVEQAVLEYVKRLLPNVLKQIQKSVKNFNKKLK